MFKPIEELLDKSEILEGMPTLYATEKEGMKDRFFRMRFYHPLSKWSWYAVEYDPKKRIFFGWVDGDFEEWGFFGLAEMAFVELQGVPIFWDIDFKPIRFADLKSGSS